MNKYLIENDTTFFKKQFPLLLDEVTFVANDSLSITIQMKDLTHYYRPFTFDGTDLKIGCALEGNVLKLSSLVQLENQSTVQLTYLINNKINFISAGCTVHVPPTVNTETLLIEHETKKSKNGCVQYIAIFSHDYPIRPIKRKGRFIPFKSLMKQSFEDLIPSAIFEVNVPNISIIGISDSFAELFKFTVTDTAFTANFLNKKMLLSIIMQKVEVTTHNSVLLHTDASPFFTGELVATDIPQVKSVLLSFGNIDIVLDLKTIWQIFNTLIKENKHLQYLFSRADMQIIKKKINTSLVLKNTKSVVSDIMTKDSYILFVPEQMFVNDFVDLLSFKHFVLQLGKISIACVNKRNKDMPMIIALLPSISQITIPPYLRKIEVYSIDHLKEKMMEKKNFSMVKELVLKNEIFGFPYNKFKKVQTKKMNIIKKGWKYIGAGICMIEASLEYISSTMHVACREDPSFNREFTALEVFNWGISSVSFSIVSGLKMIIDGCNLISKDFWRAVKMIIEGLFIRGNISIIDSLLVLIHILSRCF